MNKIKTIKLSDGHSPVKFGTMKEDRSNGRFRVEQVTDSVEFFTGQFLDRPQVEELCEARDWKVTIVPVKG